jgi:hypothetical protein
VGEVAEREESLLPSRCFGEASEGVHKFAREAASAASAKLHNRSEAEIARRAKARRA